MQTARHTYHLPYVIAVPFKNKNSSGDEIANVNFLTTISHTRRPTSKYRKRDKPTSFNKLDDGSFNTKKLCSRLFSREVEFYWHKQQYRIFVPPFGGLRGNVHGSSMARWKARDQLPIGDN